MGKNQYAVRLMAMKAAMSMDEKKALVRRNLGPERIARFRDTLDKTLVAYGVEQDNNDTDYADANLEEAYLRIMGEYYKKEN